MSAGLVGLVLLAAGLHAGWNTLVKGGGDRLVTLSIVSGSAGVLGAAALPFVGWPTAEAVPFLAASVGVHTLYNGLLVATYREGDLAQVYPIMRGTAVVWTMVGSAVWVDERPGALALVAVALIAGGVLALAVRREAPAGSGRALRLALATGVAISAYTLLDGVGVRQAGGVVGYAAWLFAGHGLAVAAFVAVVRGRSVGRAVRASWRAGLGGGAMSVGAYGLVLVAMRAAPLGPVAALRETSVLFAAALGAAVLKEPLGWRRALAAGAVAVGVVLLRV